MAYPTHGSLCGKGGQAPDGQKTQENTNQQHHEEQEGTIKIKMTPPGNVPRNQNIPKVYQGVQ